MLCEVMVVQETETSKEEIVCYTFVNITKLVT